MIKTDVDCYGHAEGIRAMKMKAADTIKIRISVAGTAAIVLVRAIGETVTELLRRGR